MLSKRRTRRRQRRHGFLHRMSTSNGRNVINRRRSKGRHILAPLINKKYSKLKYSKK